MTLSISISSVTNLCVSSIWSAPSFCLCFNLKRCSNLSASLGALYRHPRRGTRYSHFTSLELSLAPFQLMKCSFCCTGCILQLSIFFFFHTWHWLVWFVFWLLLQIIERVSGGLKLHVHKSNSTSFKLLLCINWCGLSPCEPFLT